MNILSLFDGMSCGQIVLNRIGIKYDKYFSSEIDKYAIKVTQHNYPNTVQLDDVRTVKSENLPKIDLLIGGSPCQGFSFSGKQLNFNDPRSKLFFEFVRLLKECKPKHFLLENVLMKKEYEKVITEYLDVQPIKINSALVSAQNRVRLYWTNITVDKLEDKNIKLEDILDSDDMKNAGAIRGRYKGTIVGRRLNQDGKRDDYNLKIPIIQCLEVRSVNMDKSNCLTTVSKDNVLTSLPVGRYLNALKDKIPFRYYSIKECCRLQTVPEDYFKDIASENQIRKMLGNGWTVNIIVHIFKGIEKENNNEV